MILTFAAFAATAQTQGPPMVEVALPLQRDITDVDVFTGRFVAAQDIEMRAEVSGFVDSIVFADGDLVAEGQVLFVLDKRRPFAEVQRQNALLQQAEATLGLAGTELDRAQSLLARNATARSEVDQRLADVAVAEALVASAKASVDLAQIELDDTDVRAPFAGRVSDARVDVGDLVERSTVLTTLVSVDPVDFVFDGSENDYLRYVRLDLAGRALASRSNAAPVMVRLADEADWTHPGTINFIDNRIDNASGTIRVRARLDNPQGLLAPGLFGQVQVPSFGPYEALLLPETAILSDQASRIVYVLGENEVVEVRRVEIGALDGRLRVVRDGLQPTDRVVVNGLLRVRPGTPVVPQVVELAEAAE